MKHPAAPLAAALALLLLAQCKKSDPDPTSQLPPATQTGANTFGCLVNGQAWTPQGYTGLNNYIVSYDPSYHFGTLNVSAYRYENGQSKSQAIGVFSDSLLPGVGTYRFRVRGRHGAAFDNGLTNCYYSSTDVGTYCKGSLTITRLDLTAGIVSGTFAFTLAKPGCDTVKVTQGRFDKRL